MASTLDAMSSAEIVFEQMQKVFESQPGQKFVDIVNENSRLKAKKDEWEVTNRNNLESIADLQQRMKDGAAKASSQIADMAALRAEKQELESLLSTKDKSAGEKEAQLKQKAFQISKLSADLAKAESDRAKLEKQRGEEDKKLKAAEKEMAKAKKELADLQNTFSGQSKKLESLEKLQFKLQEVEKKDM